MPNNKDDGNVVKFAPKLHSLQQADVAEAFIQQNHDRVRFDHTQNCWRIFSLKRGIWISDGQRQIIHEITTFAKKIDSATDPKLGRAAVIRGIEELARCFPVISTKADDWDTHRHILATPAGYIDLRTGLVIAPDPKLMITQTTRVAPSDDVPVQ